MTWLTRTFPVIISENNASSVLKFLLLNWSFDISWRTNNCYWQQAINRLLYIQLTWNGIEIPLLTRASCGCLAENLLLLTFVISEPCADTYVESQPNESVVIQMWTDIMYVFLTIDIFLKNLRARNRTWKSQRYPGVTISSCSSCQDFQLICLPVQIFLQLNYVTAKKWIWVKSNMWRIAGEYAFKIISKKLPK